jgi:hypothetical protein
MFCSNSVGRFVSVGLRERRGGRIAFLRRRLSGLGVRCGELAVLEWVAGDEALDDEQRGDESVLCLEEAIEEEQRDRRRRDAAVGYGEAESRAEDSVGVKQ